MFCHKIAYNLSMAWSLNLMHVYNVDAADQDCSPAVPRSAVLRCACGAYLVPVCVAIYHLHPATELRIVT